MSFARYSYGIQIEGIGSDTSKTGGIVWYIGAPNVAPSGSSYEWVGGYQSGQGLASRPRKLLFAIDPFVGEIRDSSEVFSLHDDALSRKLLRFVQSEFYLTLNGEITSSQTDNIFLSGNSATGMAGQVVWIDDEAILMGTHQGGGEYDGCTRQMWGTIGTRHFDGAGAYEKNNRLFSRLVRLIRYDHNADTETVVWRGAITDDIVSGQNGTTIEIPTRGLIALIKGAEINRNAPNLISDSSVSLRLAKSGTLKHASGGFRVDERRVGKASGGPSTAWYQVDEALVYGTYQTPVMTGFNIYSNSHEGLDYDEEKAGPYANADIEEKIYEVFVIARELDEEGDDVLNSPLSTAADSVTGALDDPFHPVAISMALLTSNNETSASGYNVLASDWGAGIPLAWFDTTAISDLIDATPEAKIDRLILGWDGERVNAFETAKRICASRGFFITITGDGLISFARRKQASVVDVAGDSSVTPLNPILQWEQNKSASVDNIRAEVGGYPWQDPIVVEVAGIDYDTGEPIDSMRAAIFVQRNQIDLDLTTMSDDRESLITLLNELAERHFAAPIVTIKVPNGTYDVGDFIRIADPGVTMSDGEGWWLENDGTTSSDIDATSDAQFFGQIIRRDYVVEKDYYLLTLLLANYRTGKFARYRSPSAEVASVASNVITVEPGVFGANDYKQFTVGDFVYITKPDGSRRGASNEIEDITAIGANTITVRNAFSTAPVDGDIIRVAKLDATGGTGVGYPEGGNASIFSGYLAYTYLGDTNDEVGPSDLDSHIYSGDRI